MAPFAKQFGALLRNQRFQTLVQLFTLSGKGFIKNHCPTWAAAIAYYTLLSLFPLLLAAASIAAYFVDPMWAMHRTVELLGDFIPKGQKEIEQIVHGTLNAAKGGAGILAVLPLLWSGSMVFGAVARTLNITFGGQESYGLLMRVVVRLVSLVTVGFIFLLALSSSMLMGVLNQALEFLPEQSMLLKHLLINAMPAMLLVCAFFLAYRFLPARRPGWRSALLGAAVATAIFFAAKPLFLGYVQQMARHNVVYGSLAGIVAVVIWTWVVSMIGLFGGELASHSQKLLFEGRNPEEVEQGHSEEEKGKDRDADGKQNENASA